MNSLGTALIFAIVTGHITTMCVDETGGLFTEISKPIVQAMRDNVRRNCQEIRGE